MGEMPLFGNVLLGTQWEDIQKTYLFTSCVRYVLDHDYFPSQVMNYYLRMQNGEDLPPMHVMQHGGKWWVVDGRHRVIAHLLSGKSEIASRIMIGCIPECPCNVMR